VKLLGATAIDDKLQEEVPETIEQPLDVELENS
jgi:magnesium-transporting ATPase (P-type)